ERRPSRRRKNVRKPGRASPAAPGIATNDEKDPVVGEFSFAGVVAELEASAAPEEADPPGVISSAIALLTKNGLEPARAPGAPGALGGGGSDDSRNRRDGGDGDDSHNRGGSRVG